MKRLLLFFLCSAVARADRPPDWLKLPGSGDPRPQSASAWVLNNDERIVQEGPDAVSYRYRYASMVLSEAGVSQAFYTLPTISFTTTVVSAHAWAMSPDGKKCREFGTAEFVVFAPSVSNETWDLLKDVYFDARKYVQPGWVWAVEVEAKSLSEPFDIRWEPRSTLPQRSASLELVPAAGGSVRWKQFSNDLPQPVPGENAGALKWTIADVPGFDPDVPSNLLPDTMRLSAYLLASPSEAKSWADMVRLARNEMDPKAVETADLEGQARRLQGTGDLWSRIRPICKFVSKEISYMQITIDTDAMAGYRPHSCAEVFNNRYGDCKDKALLLCTLLHAVGVEARVMLVNYGAPRQNVPDWPSGAFNHAIVAIACAERPPKGSTVVHAGGSDYVLFDPTDDHVPFGLLPFGDTGGEGLALASDVTATVTIPAVPPETVASENDVDIALAKDGSAKVRVTETRFGLQAADAIAVDTDLPLSERTGHMERRIQSRVPLISGLSWNSSNDEGAETWTRSGTFSARYFGKRMSGGMYVATDLMSAVPRAAPWFAKSPGWVNFSPETLRRKVSLSVPEGWEVAELPADWSIKTAAGAGNITYSNAAGKVHGEMQLTVNGGVLERGQYLALRDLLEAANAAEHRPVVLRPIESAVAPAGAPPR